MFGAVSGSILCLDPSYLLWKPRGATQKPSPFLPSLTLFSLSLQGGQDGLLAKTVVSSLLPLRAVKKILVVG